MGNQCCATDNITKEFDNINSIHLNLENDQIQTQLQVNTQDSFKNTIHKFQKTAETMDSNNFKTGMASRVMKCTLNQKLNPSKQLPRLNQQFVPFEIIKLTLSENFCKIVYFLRCQILKKFQKQENKDRKWKINKKGFYILEISEDLVHIFTQNSYYEGSYIYESGHYKPNKSGTYINLQGMYKGQFSKGIANGKGCFYFPQCDNTYTGQWVDGSLEHGTFQDKKVRYEGQFKNGQFSGKGKISFKCTNTTYEGLFITGEYEDKNGLFICDDHYYSGGFENGKKNGYGELLQYQKIVEKKIGGNKNTKIFRQQIKIKGNWINDKIIKPQKD